MLEAIRNRRSIRSYTPKDVDDALVHELLESARIAPSGSNKQPWAFIVVREDKMREAITHACHNQEWMLQAPVFFVCVADLARRMDVAAGTELTETSPEWEAKAIVRDTAIATEHIVLQAEDLGLSTCWIAWFEQEKIRSLLSIPPDKYAVAVITVGYSDATPGPQERLPLEEIVHFERWGA